jgi:hypothetical protein
MPYGLFNWHEYGRRNQDERLTHGPGKRKRKPRKKNR